MFPRIICRVQALYPFNSNDPSSLNFEKGDYIDVLAQLDSGWWDGWCGGARGWFPSNYVQVVETCVGSPPEREPTPPPSAASPGFTDAVEMTYSTPKPVIQKKRPSHANSISIGATQFGWTGLTNSVAITNSGPRLPTGWSEQLAEDGRTRFYYNHRNGKMQYQHPGLTNSDSEYDSQDEESIGIDNNESIASSADEDESYRGYRARKPVQHGHQRHLSIDSLPANVDTPETVVSDAPDHILAHWVERVTPQGRTYYCNLLTQETTWDANEIDKLTGRLRHAGDSDSDLEDGLDRHVEPFRTPEAHEETPKPRQTAPLTWQKLSSDIAMAIHQLNLSAQHGERESFTAHASAIVSAIRLLMYASRSLDKESGHMRDRVLRDPHRAVMAALSKMILSVKMASESGNATVQNESVYRVQRDAGDVLAAVRAFVLTCQQRQVAVQQVDPTLLPEHVRSAHSEFLASGQHADSEMNSKRTSLSGTTIVQKARYPLNQDLLVSLETHANQIFGTTDALSKAAVFILTLQRESLDEEEDEQIENSRDDSKARSNVVTLFRRFSMQVGQYLSILEDIDFSNVDGNSIPSLAEAQVNKQRLYNAVGILFSAVQAITAENAVVEECVSKIENAVKHVEEVINDVASTTEDMVEQRKIWLNKLGSMDGEIPMSPTTVSMNKGEHDWHMETSDKDHAPSHQQRPSIGSNSAFKTSITTGGLNHEKARKRQTGVRSHDERAEQPDMWYLGDDYEEGEIVFGADGNVRGGTLPALVARLTPHDTLDTNFIATFLLTYRSFCTTEEFISELEKRYNLRAPEGLMPDELEIWTERKQKLVRFRMFNVIKSWLENYYNEEDEFILNRLEFFTNTVIRDSSTFSADQLNRLIRKRRELDANGGLKKLVPKTSPAPLPIFPKDLSRFTLLDIDPVEMSRQLTLIDFKLYSKIRPIECFNKAWSEDDKEGATESNVKKSINYCNRLTCWVTNSILANDEAKKRVSVIKFWAQVAVRCRSMCNFNTCMAIISAFDNSAVGRLKKTWELVGNRTTADVANIRKLMGSNRNFQEYRDMVHSINPPCIPFLGIYLQDLTFIEDGNPDYLKKSSNLISFAKRQMAAEVIREISQFQSPSYTYQAVPEIQAFINTHLESSHDVDALYERSLQLEPREPAS